MFSRVQKRALTGCGARAPGPGSTAAASTVTKFTGGDSGEGLNLTGTYVYAVNVNGPAGNTVQGLTFTADPGTAAVTIIAPHTATEDAAAPGSTRRSGEL